MNEKQTRAIESFFRAYFSDLINIRNFQRYKNQKSTNVEESGNKLDSFKNFLVEFRVIRNVEQGKSHDLLNHTIDWIKSSNPDDVDGFAKFILDKDMTRGKLSVSLASKILMLNNPWKILPIDSMSRRSVNQKNNCYSDFLKSISEFKDKNKNEIVECLESIDEHSQVIEKYFKNEIEDIKTIRYNRFIDKYLWANGLNEN
jgi:hypothetical protein